MPPLGMLIKPASGNCNLRCRYCFYHSVAENREIESYGMMSLDTLETIVKKALVFADQACTFAFQGGEPTLVGLDFYRKLIEYEKKYNTKKVQINNALQTNGMVIDDEWAEFLSVNKFLVGLSLDGPKDIHDINRYDAKGNGSFNRVMNTVKLFDKHKVEYNILFVANANTGRHISKIYSFFKKNNFKYLQFIPCLDPLNEEPGQHEYSLTPERFGSFLKSLFDLWYEDIVKGEMVSIRYFDNLVGMIMGYPPEACGMKGECMCQFVTEADGGVYPCDFYVIDEWYLGNIKESGFEELAGSNAAVRFIESSRHVDTECKECKWANICRGGCRRYREPFEDGKPVLSYFCSSYMEFFEYSADRLMQLARMFSQKG
jgi:uncharacterized protein